MSLILYLGLLCKTIAVILSRCGADSHEAGPFPCFLSIEMTKDVDFSIPSWLVYTLEDNDVDSHLSSGAVNYWSGDYGRKI